MDMFERSKDYSNGLESDIKNQIYIKEETKKSKNEYLCNEHVLNYEQMSGIFINITDPSEYIKSENNISEVRAERFIKNMKNDVEVKTEDFHEENIDDFNKGVEDFHMENLETSESKINCSNTKKRNLKRAVEKAITSDDRILDSCSQDKRKLMKKIKCSVKKDVTHSNSKLFKCSEYDNIHNETIYIPSNLKININDLIHSFSSKSYDDKLNIVKVGRPKPALKNLISKHKDKNHIYTRQFSISQYNTRKWLTGCEILSKLFCWPCLLFSAENGVWNKHGFDDLNHLTTAMQRHEKSRVHVQSCFALQMFDKQKIDSLIDNQQKYEICQHNNQVKKNRNILKRLIDAVCFHTKQDLPLRDDDESARTDNKGNYKEFLNILREYDLLLDTHLNTCVTFEGTSLSVQNDIIQSLSIVVENYIKMELNSATFVAVILDETSDVLSKSQLSTVLRFVRGGRVYERFIGFSDVSADRTAEGLFRHIFGVVEEYQIQGKLVGQTYDGACVMSGHIDDLKKKVLDQYPYTIFTHCYAHELNLVLQQGLSNIQECNIFFQTLNEITAYFSKSSKMKSLHEFVSRKLPSVTPTSWNFTSHLTYTVQQYRVQLTDFFKNVIENAQNWDSDSTLKARGFLNFLQEFQTVFLLEIFSKIFGYTNTLYKVLQMKTYDVIYCCNKVSDVLQQIKCDRDYMFEDLWKLTLSNGTDTEELLYKTETEFLSERDVKEAYRGLHYRIADNIAMHLEARFSSLSNLKFFELLWYENYEKFKISFPDDLVGTLKCQYGILFDYIRLKNELIILYVNPYFSKKHVYELVEFIVENELTTVFTEMFKLAELVLTIPSNTASEERFFSTLRRIRTCSSHETQMPSFRLLSIEKNLLTELRQGTSFYDDVIEQFLLQKKRTELIYK